MLNSLDLLVIVSLVLAALSLLALSLMFLVRNPRLKKICFYMTAVLGIYISTVSVRIFGWFFLGQSIVGLVLGAAAVAALVLALTAKGSEKKWQIARILAAAALVLGIVNAIL